MVFIKIFGDIRVELDNLYKKRKIDVSNPQFNNKTIVETCKDKTICEIVKIIELDLPNATLVIISDKINMSSVYLSKYFKDKTGVNFSDYIIATKMYKAAVYLTTSDFKLSHISELIGYSNEKNFSRAFKGFFGVNPSQYKEFE